MGFAVTGHRLTDEHLLAAYVDGSDLHDVAPVLREQLERFRLERQWPGDQILLVDHRFPVDPAFPEFLPQWDLGLNLGLDGTRKNADWFRGTERLVEFLTNLSRRTGREFVLFLCYRSHPERQDHLCFVGPNEIDLSWLQKAIGRLLPHSGEGTESS